MSDLDVSAPERDTGGASGAGAPPRRHQLNFGLDRFSGAYVWAAIIVVFAIWIPSTFLTSVTLRAITGEQAIAAIVALGLLIPLSAGVFDLSVAYILGFTSVTLSWLIIDKHVPELLAVLIAMLIGVGFGAVNGFIVVRLKVPSFIATLAMGSVLQSAIIWISGGQEVVGTLPHPLIAVGQSQWLGLPSPFFYMIGVALILWFITEHTTVGRYLFAIGGNPETARLAGVRTDRYIFGSLVVSGFVASLAGILYLAQIGASSLTAGDSYLFPTFAAAFLGATQIRPGRFNVWGTLLAIYLLATGVKGLELVPALSSTEQWIGSLFYGLALIAAVALAAVRRSRKGAGAAGGSPAVSS